MTHSRLAAVAVALVSACVVAPLLSGCTPTSQKQEELEGFADQVRELAFVRDVAMTTNEALPFSVTGDLRITLEPETDRAAIDELHDLTCSVDTMVRPTLSLTYMFASGAMLTNDDIAQCWTDPLEFFDVLPALTPHEAELSHVGWKEISDDDDGDSLEIEVDLIVDTTLIDDTAPIDDATSAGVLPAAEIASKILTSLDENADRSVALRIRGISIPPTTLAEAKGVVGVAIDVASLYPLGKVTAEEDGLFIELTTDVPGMVEEVRTFVQETYPEQKISAVVDSSAGVGGSTPNQMVLDAGDAIRASTMATTVETAGDRIDVTTPSLAANVEIARLLESRGMGGITVSYYTVLESGAWVKVDAGAGLATSRLADIEVLTNALLPSGQLSAVHYTSASLGVYMTDEVTNDVAAVAAFTATIHETLDSGRIVGKFRNVQLNNRTLG